MVFLTVSEKTEWCPGESLTPTRGDHKGPHPAPHRPSPYGTLSSLQTNEGVDGSDGIACSTLYTIGSILCLLDRYPDLSARVQSCTVTWGRVS
jgi:hypothetical protein